MQRLLVLACTVTVLLSACTGPPDDRPPAGGSAPSATSQPSPAEGPSPDELADLAVGPATSIAWWQRGRLHAHGRTWRARAPSNIYQAADTVLVERFHRNRMTLLHWTADGPAPIFTGPLYDVVLSPYGDLAVWMEPVGDDLRRLTAWDVAAGEISDRLDIPVDVVCCDRGGDVVLFGIAADHRLMYAVGGEPFTWSPWSLPRSAPVPVTGVAQPVLGHSWPRGLMVQGRSDGLSSPPGIYGRVGIDGAFRRSGRTKTDQLGVWSPTGRAFAYLADEGRIRVQDVKEATDEELLLPPGRIWGFVGWEDAKHLVMSTVGEPDAGERRGVAALVRCHVVSLVCERVAEGPTGSVRLPEA